MKTKGAACPNCQTVLDGAMNIGNVGRPEPGDVSICAYCSQINKFTDDLGLRAATRSEARVLLQDKNVRAAVGATVQARRRR